MLAENSTEEALTLAVSFYEANNTPGSGIQERGGKTALKVSIREVASSHGVPYSTLRRRLAGKGGDRGKAHESQQLLTSAEELALRNWILQMASWGFPVRIDHLKQMAAAVLCERGLRNILSVYDFFD